MHVHFKLVPYIPLLSHALPTPVPLAILGDEHAATNTSSCLSYWSTLQLNEHDLTWARLY